jgi:hypothetical protein
VIMTTMMNGGMMNIGVTDVGMKIVGCITHMDTTVYIMYGGIHGGGIITGGIAIGAITSIGISFTRASMLCGMKMVVGGLDQDMVTG